MKKLFLITITSVLSLFRMYAQEDNTKYIDPTIGNVSRFLVPTYPTIHLPNQMMRMFPVKKDYISDIVQGFPLQVTAHRRPGILQMKAASGTVKPNLWKKGMPIDHDLEVVHPWLYSTYLIEDDIRVSFTPSKKSAIYKFEFPEGKQKNILMKGSKDMRFESKNASFNIIEKRSKKTKGEHAVDNITTIYVYGEVLDKDNLSAKNVTFSYNKSQLQISDSNASTTLHVKYGISYISAEQAQQNFNKEVGKKNF